MKVDTVIVGAGSAGLSALREVCHYTDDFLLVNDGHWVTTCAAAGCMPSKALIEAVNAFHRRGAFEAFGIRGAQGLSADIFGAVCPARGATAALFMPNADTHVMNAHLAKISRLVAKGAHAILVLDGAGWHGSKALRVPENITLLPLPPYALELNPIENVWA